MIENIKIERLHSHPDNPRQNVGDVSELAESIKVSGVLQNLTVIPATGHYHGDYIVLIGHRRLAAAKQAGLTELPCSVVEMSKSEQIATMLVENMQRSELNPYEQAQGIQMMLDLGETIDDVVEKTGFSKSTVKRRTKLLQLDKDKFEASRARQVTFLEYDKLFEIEDEKKRNELLDVIGTANFNNKFESAKRDEIEKKNREEMIARVKLFATEIDSDYESYKDKKYVTCIWRSDQVEDVTIISGVNHYFYARGIYLYIYRDYTEEENQRADELEKSRDKEAQKQAAKNERKMKLKELSERFYKLRYNFIKDCPDVRVKTETIMEFAVNSFIQSWGEETNIEQFEELLEKNIVDEEVPVYSIYKQKTKDNPRKALLYAAYAHFDDRAGVSYNTWDGEHRENEDLDNLYDMLELLGYEMSDEEKQWRDGTHPLYEAIE